MYLDKYFKQQATYWAPSTTDSFGKQTFVAPTVVPVRWEDIQQQAIDARGREITSKAQVYCSIDVDLEFDGFLFNGISIVPDPSDLMNAFQIRNIEKVPSIRSLQQLQMIIL